MKLRICMFGGIFAGLAASIATASTVSLGLDPAVQVVPLGGTVNIDLWAYSDDATPDVISVMEVIMDWDPGVLSLTGNTDAFSGYPWLSSSFPAAGDFGLNAAHVDGDAYYSALSQFANPPGSAMAPMSGLLVTTFQFTATALSAGTIVDLPISDLVSGAQTQVIGDIPNFDILGGTTGATVVVIPEPHTAALLMGLLGITIRRRRRA